MSTRRHLRPCPPPRALSAQRGVVLVITLVLIVILSLLGTLAIRNATQAARSVKGVQSAETAREAAETALRFCEQIAIFDGAGKDYTEYGTTGLRGRIIATTIISEQDPSAAWRTAANWIGASVIEVPAQYYKRYDSNGVAADAVQLRTAPRCLIQKLESAGTPKLKGYLITARGFANNARYDPATGTASQGAEAWLQSVLTKS